MEFNATQIADILKGIIEGDENTMVNNLGKIESATKSDLCFLANMKYENHIYTTNAAIVIVNNDFEPKQEIKTTLIRVEDAYVSFSQILEFYQGYIKSLKIGVEEPSFIGENTKFGDNIYFFLFDNKLIEWLFEIKARKVISSEEITENHKIYTVLTYLDGKKVYKYNNKTHREIGAASFYPKKYFTFSNYRNKYFIHGKQVSIDQFEKFKIQHNFENF